MIKNRVKSQEIRRTQEFGDFQTPPELALEVCSLLAGQGVAPASVLEPTCGVGNFIGAAFQTFSAVQNAVGIDINTEYVGRARLAFGETRKGCVVDIRQADFFSVDWDSLLVSLPEPLLVIGNPPWVTNSALSSLGSSNLPEKTNHQNHRGIDAITGRSNFDISEWMLVRMLDWVSARRATLAMLCKTSVARKVLGHAWKNGYRLAQADIYRIDAQCYFGAAVDACLLVVTSSDTGRSVECQVHDSLSERNVTGRIGYYDGRLLADASAYESWKHLEGEGSYKWRSGIKHDCAKVMELVEHDGRYWNGLGEAVDIEDEYLYPMMKSSDVASSFERPQSRYVIVPQRFVGDDTGKIKQGAPKTWKYLESHSDLLDRRASSIYRNRPKFSIFGVGEYSFAMWKVAISGFYKRLRFKVLGPMSGKPVMLDDTCYFIPCKTEEEAVCISEMLNSDIAREFYSAFIFWDAKRPVTIEILQRLDLLSLAAELGVDTQLIENRPGVWKQLRLN